MIDAHGPTAALSRFSSPADTLGAVDADTAAALVTASSDVAVVVDAAGTITDVAFGNPELAKELYRDWIGRPWIDTVTAESRAKIEEMIRDAMSRAAPRDRQVNYPGLSGPDVPLRYRTIRLTSGRRFVALGRDLRAMAALQQRLAEAQQAMEREYARIRGAEKRYRLLFQLAAEAVLIVDAGNQRIVEANPAAAAMIGADQKKFVGHLFADLFEPSSRQAAQSFVAALRVAPRVDNVHVQLPGGKESVLLSGSLFRQENEAHLLVILTRLGGGVALSGEQSNILRVFDKLPEAIVVTDPERRILTANAAFVDLVQMTNEEQVRGELVDRWIGRPGVDVDVLFATLRTHGVVRHFSTVLRGEYNGTEDVEITAVSAPGGTQPCIGFSIRSTGWRAGREKLGGRELPRTAEQFTDLVGRVPLKNLVRETTDLIERLCIEAALELTGNNRASAAEMLGLSRQSLYAKMRRSGLDVHLSDPEQSN